MFIDAALRLDVASPELLDRLVTAVLPHGLRAGRVQRGFHRDIYLDTPDGELQQLGVTCRFRISMADRRTLTVTVRETVGVGELVTWTRFEATVDAVDPLDALGGVSEPARRLRALLDPRRLGVRVELETERLTRVARSATLPLKTLEVAYDRVTVRSGGLRRAFQEVLVRKLRRGGPSLDDVAGAFGAMQGVRSVFAGRLERAEELLNAMEGDVPEAEVTTGERRAGRARRGGEHGRSRGWCPTRGHHGRDPRLGVARSVAGAGA
jgi:hypothetical protein